MCVGFVLVLFVTLMHADDACEEGTHVCVCMYVYRMIMHTHEFPRKGHDGEANMMNVMTMMMTSHFDQWSQNE